MFVAPEVEVAVSDDEDFDWRRKGREAAHLADIIGPMMKYGILPILTAVALVALLALSGVLVGIQELACDESSCDSSISQCACCTHLLRSILVQEKRGLGSSIDSHLAAELYGPFYELPPHEILHVPKHLS